jgi:hypothetical protein
MLSKPSSSVAAITAFLEAWDKAKDQINSCYRHERNTRSSIHRAES